MQNIGNFCQGQKVVFFIFFVVSLLHVFLKETNEFQNDDSFGRKRIKNNIWS